MYAEIFNDGGKSVYGGASILVTPLYIENTSKFISQKQDFVPEVWMKGSNEQIIRRYLLISIYVDSSINSAVYSLYLLTSIL